MPCFGRPQRTARAIESILAQTINNWKAYIVGDCCPQFQELMDANKKLGNQSWEARAKENGNEIIIFNAVINEGGWGYAIRNYFHNANDAEFLVYLDNDDVLQPDHFQNYLSGIEGTDNDFVFFNTNTKFTERYMSNFYAGTPGAASFAPYIRDSKAEEGWIGHAELIIRSSFLKEHPEIQQLPTYGHDWKFIKAMIAAGAKYKKADNPRATYNVMGAGELRETDID